jgi:hypothetical protein
MGLITKSQKLGPQASNSLGFAHCRGPFTSPGWGPKKLIMLAQMGCASSPIQPQYLQPTLAMLFVNKKLLGAHPRNLVPSMGTRATRVLREHSQVTLKKWQCAPDTSWAEVARMRITWYVFEGVHE